MARHVRTPGWLEAAGHAAKAISGAVVSGAGYLMGVLPATATPADITFIQWLGLVVAVGGTFGIVYRVPNRQ